MTGNTAHIHIRGGRENNLKNISLDIPHGKLIAVTGISGSGKSSLAFDIIAAEARRQYLESIPSFARQFSGKITKPDVDEISGLYPVISIGQSPPRHSPKSTLGTVSEIYDHLRLLFARFGRSDDDTKLTRSLFSFNSPAGACPECSGLGLEERISMEKLIKDSSLSLGEGALAPTLPGGYIMYSQLTIDALDTVCREHGFNVDIPWKDLTDEQRAVVLYGSKRIKVLKGKHTIESRLRWTGLKAKPREYGYYQGIVNIMEDILRRDRNPHILRYTESLPCSQCNGKRLNDRALAVQYRDFTIDRLCDMELQTLLDFFRDTGAVDRAEEKICGRIINQLVGLCKLGAGHLQLSRSTDSLSGGEMQRLRLVNQLSAAMTRVLYVLDEPSTGMHPRDTSQLISILRRLVSMGNTVIIVEHDPEIIRSSDWIIETGPGAGINGGEILFNGPTDDFIAGEDITTPTRTALLATGSGPAKTDDKGYFSLGPCNHNNLKGTDLNFRLSAVNVITGVPGAGKSSLVYGCLIPKLEKVIRIDRSPIGRTPRSNPATYTGMADHVRDLFARQDKARELGFSRGRFSFNNKGGRCEKCEGAGKIQIGMHYMGNIDITCDRCNGRRFNDETLLVRYKGKNISDIYDLSINQAAVFLSDQKGILRYLKVMQSLGLGYLKLGQSSTTLSGGEAQRIKLAAALSRKLTAGTWIILDEPTTGLHYNDTLILMAALRKLAERGNTIVAIEYQEQFISLSDHIIELGPGSGSDGGNKVYEGSWNGFIKNEHSLTAAYINETVQPEAPGPVSNDKLSVFNCTTHNLKGIDIHINTQEITVITGISGSGKSSLAFDTIYSEARSRFSESLSTFSRTFIRQSNPARAESYRNLSPALAVNRKNLPLSLRSTAGTLTGIYEKYRYLFSRIAGERGMDMSARQFSFNHESGACPVCSGLGYMLKADPRRLVSDWKMSVAGGALTHNSTIRYYGNPSGQFVAILREAGKPYGIDINRPLEEYNDEQLKIVFEGTGDKIWTAEWNFRNKSRSWTREISGIWRGFAGLVEDEYHRKLHNKDLSALRSLMYEKECPACRGARLNQKALSVYAGGLNIGGLSGLSVDETEKWFKEKSGLQGNESLIISSVYEKIRPQLLNMQMLGLGHIAINRRSSSLSGGEGQRLRLARQLSGALTGMIYVLDEPTIGLHPADVENLLKVISRLKDRGNTVIIVEHDREVIRWAGHIIELGPGAGKEGGMIIEQGRPEDFILSEKSLITPYLVNNKLPEAVPRQLNENAFGLKGVNKHNLVNRDFSFSSGGIIAITGRSGAGKSTLIHHVLAPSLNEQRPVNCKAFYDNEGFDEYIIIDHRAVTGNITSTVASYSSLLDKITRLFAAAGDAGDNSPGKAAFSYNSKEGRCPVCKGAGKIRVSMDFMDDIWNTCYSCRGLRYNDKVLNVRLKGVNIAQLLQYTVNEAIIFFSVLPGKTAGSIAGTLINLQDTGLGHIHLAQELQSLSGGEAQRLKLSLKLAEGRGRKILYMMDEPTSGLAYPDIDRLADLFNRLVDRGHTVLFIEHNPYLVAVANQVVEL